jgi:hypothetical protein
MWTLSIPSLVEPVPPAIGFSSSWSRLFTDALREYLARPAPDKVTGFMDQAIMEVATRRGSYRRGGDGRETWGISSSFQN